MKLSLFISVALVLFSPVLLFGQTSDTSVPLSQLKNVPFIAGPLKITFTHFRGNQVIAGELRFTGVGNVQIEVENISDDFATFEPLHLSVVGKNEGQTDILGLIHNNEIYPVESRRIAPKAKIKAEYVLTDKVELPARIYYEDKLIVSIRE
jgi:hypothetical protein